MSRKRKLLLIGGVLLVSCCVLTIAYYLLIGLTLFSPYSCLGDEPYSEQTIERMGNFTIPESARNLNATSQAWQDCLVYIDFEMDASELDSFLATTYASELVPTRGRLPGFDDYAYERWGLDRSKRYLYGGGGNGSSEGQYLAIDTDDPENYKVYLISLLL